MVVSGGRVNSVLDMLTDSNIEYDVEQFSFYPDYDFTTHILGNESEFDSMPKSFKQALRELHQYSQMPSTMTPSKSQTKSGLEVNKVS